MQSHALPIARPGQRVGLLGGSFDPAHQGHVHLTRVALKRFGLDRVWWLVSPGNPMKARGPAPLEMRLERAREVMAHPRVEVTAIEARLGTRYTRDTIDALQSRYGGVRFTWVMGADILDEFHRWHAWREIAARVRLGVVARPGQRMAARTSPAARALRAHRLAEAESHLLGGMPSPAWCFVNAPMVHVSSTGLRRAGHWPTQSPTDAGNTTDRGLPAAGH